MIRDPKLPQSFKDRLWHGVLGRPKDPHDPHVAHKITLVAFLAWVGLGVDGLSSSAYGPAEAYASLGENAYLAVALAGATALTVFVISYAYSRLIEHFPHGGGGYIVATQLLGEYAGVISGCALLVDYVLTITVSIASGGDAVFSLFPSNYVRYKLIVECLAILFLIFMNLRGVRESVQSIVPFFILFVVTHIILIFGGIGSHLGSVPELVTHTTQSFHAGIASIGKWGLFVLFLRGYSMGGGTYTGIEAVSNGVATLREPRIETGKRTMVYLALSLAITAGGLLLCYMLFGVKPEEGQTLNAVLARAFAGSWKIGSFEIGYWFVLAVLFSESILLLVAAQTGFIDGPRVMANMSLDSWLPRRFATLSDRLTIQNGILLMGVASLATLLFTGGSLGILIVMYSINVFITFSLSEISMIRFWITSRKTQPLWKRNLCIHGTGFVMCFSILTVMILEKFMEGAWATLTITSCLIVVCFAIRRHYRGVGERIRAVEMKMRKDSRAEKPETAPEKKIPDFDPSKPTAGILVGGYHRLGRRSLLEVLRAFPNTFHNIVFVSVGVVNSDFFRKGEVNSLEKRTDETLKGYVSIANRLGLPAKYEYRIGTDVVLEAAELCVEVSKQYNHMVFFAGELIFEKPKWFDRVLHNETAYAIQRQIRFAGLPMVILPIVLTD